MSEGPFKTYCANTMAFMDGEGHKRTRAALAPVFGPANIKKLTTIIETLCDELIASLEDRDSFDFMKDFATSFPLNVVCDILGIPRDHREIFGTGSHHVVAALEPMASAEIIDRAHTACSKMGEILGGYADERKADKDGDLISYMKAQFEDGVLSYDEFINHMIFVMVAGHETTSTLMSYSMNHLLENPGIAEELRDDPSLTQTAVSEFLRLYPPLQFVMRYTEEPYDIDDVTIPAHKMIFVGLGGANRDPEMFPNPDTCDLRRKNAAQHLAFIAGPHTCLGNNLARLETKIAFEKLLKHMPPLTRNGDAVPNTNFLFQGFSSLPVRKITAA
jgi:cytochrome P450